MNTESPSKGRSSFTDILTPRRIVALGLTALAVVFLIQNRAEVTFQLLGFRVTGPLWLASVALLATGLAIGVLITTRRSSDGGR